MAGDLNEYLDRIKPLGVLYVDIYPYVYADNGEVELLLLRRVSSVVMPGRWQPICGKIRKGERISEAFHRQVLSKTGASPTKLFKLDFVNTFYDDHYDTVMFVPSAACEVGRNVVLDGGLHDEAKFVKFSQLPDCGLFDAQLRAYETLRSALEKRTRGGNAQAEASP